MKTSKSLKLMLLVALMLTSLLAPPITVYADEDTPPPTDTTEPTGPAPESEDADVTGDETGEEAGAASDVELGTETSETPALDEIGEVDELAPDDTSLEQSSEGEEAALDGEAQTDELTVETVDIPETLPDSVEPVTEEMTPEETPEPTADSDETDAGEESTEIEEPTLAEILPELPEDTEVVILDASGQPEPLATQAAAETIATGDPVWCPGTQAPTPDDNGCSTSYGSLSELVTKFVPTGDGTIWIESGSDTGGSVMIQGYFGGNWYSARDYSLTLQGGWSGNPGDTTIGADSVFNVPISISDWNNTIIVNNITVQNVSGTGLSLSGSFSPTVNFNINNSTFSGNSGDGVNVYYAGNVNIYNSIFNGNSSDGVSVSNADNVNISNSTFSGSGTGVYLYVNEYSSSSVTIKDSIVKDNTSLGIDAIANVYNMGHGVYRGSIDLTLDCVTYENNGKDLRTSGDVTVTPNPCKEPPLVCKGSDCVEEIVPPNTNTVEFPIDCSLQILFISMWPNGDWVQIACQDNAIARITRMDNTNLPELPAGYQYVSAFDVQIIKNGVQQHYLVADGYIIASFMSRHENPQYNILYWDATNGAWVALKEYQLDSNGASVTFPLVPSNQDDPREILKGVRLVDSYTPPREEVTVNFTGILLLVQR